MKTEQQIGFQLSPQQRRLWSLQQKEEVFVTQGIFLLEGELNETKLRHAIQEVGNQHEILRSTFICPSGIKVPFQIVEDLFISSYQTIDLRERNPEEQEIQIEMICQALLERKGFSWESGSLLQYILIKISLQKHLLLCHLPSLCADSETINLLFSEIAQFYHLGDLAHDLERDNPLLYSTFADWRNEVQVGGEAEEGHLYWKRKSLLSLPEIFLPWEKKPSSETRRFECLKLKGEEIQKMEAWAQRCGADLKECLLACWSILLWRTMDLTNFTIGVCFEGRDYEDLESTMGLFSQTLPVQTQLKGNQSFLSVLEDFQNALSENEEWQEYFPEENPQTFPFVFEWGELPEPYSAGNLQLSLTQQSFYGEPFKLKLACIQEQESISFEFHYDQTRLDREEVERLAQSFLSVLKSAFNQSENSIERLNLLEEKDRQQVLFDFNSSQTNFPEARPFHHLFEEQVRAIPNQTAIVFEEKSLTYRELNKRANQLACALQEKGAKVEDFIALCIDRSLEMIIGLLGILKSGAAYLPIDPLLPQERIQWMLQEACPTIVITQSSFLENFSEYSAPTLCLDQSFFIEETQEELVLSPILPGNNLSVIFTSGSTGKPKGVVIEHQQIFHYIHAIEEKLKTQVGNHFATVSTLAMDLGNTVIFPALAQGGCLHIISSQQVLDPSDLAKYFQKNSIDFLKITPSHLEALLSSPSAKDLIPIRGLILGGEPLQWKLVEKIKSYSPQCRIFNHYGPTETTIGVTTYQIKEEEPSFLASSLPLGRPLANTQIYILDDHLQPLPIGVVGEIYIGGNGLSRGYLNHPELTAPRFLPHPFSKQPGSRVYKTGDRARYLSNGNIEFLGRRDHQVKIRGFRIELGEIETTLGLYPMLKECAVIAHKTSSQGLRLIAYLVIKTKQVPNEKELRLFLRKSLPDYMIPSVFIPLDVMPLTPNGKLDRQALLQLSLDNLESGKKFTRPRNLDEKLLAGIWSELLSIKFISIHDNFFELGGHSLLAVRLMEHIQQVFGKSLPLSALLQRSTIAQLAELLHEFKEETPWSPLVPIQSHGSKLPLFCIHPVGGNVLCYFELSQQLGLDQPLYGLQAFGIEEGQQPYTQVEEMARFYLKAIQKVQPQGPYQLLGWSFGGLVSFEIARLFQEKGQEVSFLGLLDIEAPSISEVSSIPEFPLDTAQLLVSLFAEEEIDLPLKDLRELGLNEQLTFVLEQGKKVNLFPPYFDLKRAQRLLQLFKINCQATQNYQPQNYQGKVTLFQATENPKDRSNLGPDLGWKMLSTKEVKIYLLPSNHWNMLKSPHVQNLTKQLKIHLEQVHFTS